MHTGVVAERHGGPEVLAFRRGEAPTPGAGQCVVALLRTGGNAEYAVVATDDPLAPVPGHLDPSRVACLTLNYVTGYQLFRRVAGLTAGHRVLVHGAGGGMGTAMLFDIVPYAGKHPEHFTEDMAVLTGLLARGEIDPVVAAELPLDQARRAQ